MPEDEFCVYWAEGEGMKGDLNEEDYPQMSPRHMTGVRSELAVDVQMMAALEESVSTLRFGDGDF